MQLCRRSWGCQEKMPLSQAMSGVWRLNHVCKGSKVLAIYHRKDWVGGSLRDDAYLKSLGWVSTSHRQVCRYLGVSMNVSRIPYNHLMEERGDEVRRTRKDHSLMVHPSRSTCIFQSFHLDNH